MQFSRIAGQEFAKEGVIKMYNSGHFPHALMLAGREGTGGLPMALAIAQYLFCENRSVADSCGVCTNCSKVSKLEHADLHISFPSIAPKPGTKAISRYYLSDFREFILQTPYGSTYDWLQFINAENKQGNITAEECREIIDALNLKSYEGGKKVLIMWRPEYLGKEGNILLKLIEEPPADTMLIFIAEEMEDILPTILSRTQVIKLAPIAPAAIAGVLIERHGIEERKALQIGHMADGSFSAALKLLQHSGNDLFPEVRNWFNALFTNNGVAIAKFAEEWSKAGREQQKNFLHYVVNLLEHAIRSRYLPQQNTLPDEEAAFAQKLGAMKLDVETLHAMTETISQTIYFIERNAHTKTQLHVLSLKLVYHIQGRLLPVL